MPEMSEERLKLLVYKYLADSLTEEDSDELDAFGAEHPQVWLLIARLQDEDQLTSDLAEIQELDLKGTLDEAWEMTEEKSVPFYKKPLWQAAAVILPVLAGMVIFFRHHHESTAVADHGKDTAPVVHTTSTDIHGGIYRAILTLGGGQRLELQDQPKGDIAFQHGARLVKSDGTLSYFSIPTTYSEGQPVQYNSLTTPRAGQFSVILPDGTKVWLNDSSKLTYPTFFSGVYREVALTGEAYFEVAKNREHPFHVKVNNLTINVLGTSFAVRAYHDEENTTTTLLKGKISVLDGHREQLLAPNEQVSVSRKNSWQVRKGIDPESVLAWKEGIFYFTHADIPTVMHELSNWYNIDVEIRVPATQYFYDGEFSRDVSLSVILDYLTNEDVHFIREGKKVIVTP